MDIKKRGTYIVVSSTVRGLRIAHPLKTDNTKPTPIYNHQPHINIILEHNRCNYYIKCGKMQLYIPQTFNAAKF